MNATIFETNCGEWDVVTDCNENGECKILKGFASHESAVDSAENLGWKVIGTIRILYVA